jgi:hypothetical protein
MGKVERKGCLCVGVDGTSSITDNDFNRRGEYEGGPDGCAIDFETSSSGVR